MRTRHFQRTGVGYECRLPGEGNVVSTHVSEVHEPHLDEVSPVPYLRNGQMISLVRWNRVAGDWKYTTIVVQYCGRDEITWQVIAQGQPMILDRAEWAIFN